MLLLERGVHDSLDGVHAVLGLVEDLGSGALEDLVGDLLLGDAELLALLGANGGVGVVEAGQAVQEDGTRVGHSHDLGGDTIRGELSDALGPDLVGLAHGDPHVGVDNVGTGDAVLDVGGQLDGAAVSLGDGLAGLDDVVSGHALLGAAGTKFMPSLEQTTMRERATLFLQSPMKTRVLPLMS